MTSAPTTAQPSAPADGTHAAAMHRLDPGACPPDMLGRDAADVTPYRHV
ncbi:hypothetical protein ACG04Q_19165 [Roseateles sp. DXS20W]|uniref:Uncharacterized protein n=1 Tax=Pelomonas lactea TaxID=3299030 RepID=A0ABW7GP37_9BURK